MSACWRLPWLVALAVGLPVAASADVPAAARLGAEAAPLSVRNVLPSAQLYGLPRALGAAVAERVELSLIVDHASNFSSDFESGSGVFFDGETTVASLALRGPWGSRSLEWGLELPYVAHSGGFLDGFLESFHDVTGLPDGGRSGATKNRLEYLIRYDDGTIAQVDSSQGHIGDLRAWLGSELHRSASRTLGWRVQLKLPTGRLEDLSGSGGADGALWLEYADRALLGRFGLSLSLMGGVVLLGGGDLPEAARKDAAVVGHLGLQYAATPRLVLHAQLDGHGQLLNTGLPQAADEALQGTLGGRWSPSPEYWLGFAVTEDLRSQTAPDVVFHLSMGARF